MHNYSVILQWLSLSYVGIEFVSRQLNNYQIYIPCFYKQNDVGDYELLAQIDFQKLVGHTNSCY